VSAGAFRVLRRWIVRAAVAFPHSAPRQGIFHSRKEIVMSKTCGDTARFHRLRKQKINRRAKNRILQAEIAARKAEKAAKPAA